MSLKSKSHHYLTTLNWNATPESQTLNYQSFSRNHVIRLEGKPDVLMSADPAFRGDPGQLNPEECLLMSLSSCHMLTYLTLAALQGIEIVSYEDKAQGEMVQQGNGGKFSSVTLYPIVTVAAGQDAALAESLHAGAHHDCFIANSVNFPVLHHPTTRVADTA
jgi:organic hydroperoxide reductase OsmC/OhrA